jgi:hypothetical protein
MAAAGRAAGILMLVAAACANAAASPPSSSSPEKNVTTKDVPLASVAPAQRKAVQALLNDADFTARGPSEVFQGQARQYLWLLDHPDRAVSAWQRLGAQCLPIVAGKEGQFSWSDETGSEILWQTVLRTASMRVWLAEGKVRPAPLLPLVPVKGLVVLRHHQAKMPDGKSALQHQADLFVTTDSRAANMVTRMLGPSARHMAEDGLGQLQLFFSGLTWYLDRHPDEVADLFK